MGYMHTLAVDGGTLLAKAWGTETLVADGLVGAMVNVRLPTNDTRVIASLPKALLDEYDT